MAQLTLPTRIIRQDVDLNVTRRFRRHVSVMRLLLRVVDSNVIVSAPLTNEMVVGRSGKHYQPEIDLTKLGAVDFGISRQHAVFTYEQGDLFVRDLKSTNGTRINGYRIEANKPYRLHNGDELELGDLRLSVWLVRAPG